MGEEVGNATHTRHQIGMFMMRKELSKSSDIRDAAKVEAVERGRWIEGQRDDSRRSAWAKLCRETREGNREVCLSASEPAIEKEVRNCSFFTFSVSSEE